jgi:hypothetical protein
MLFACIPTFSKLLSLFIASCLSLTSAQYILHNKTFPSFTFTQNMYTSQSTKEIKTGGNSFDLELKIYFQFPLVFFVFGKCMSSLFVFFVTFAQTWD